MIVVAGEALIDFIPTKTAAGQTAYRPACGGSPFNAAVGIARQGVAVEFMGGLSTDLFGDQLAAFLAASHVGTAFAPRMAQPTTLAFVSLEHEEPQYAFFVENTAARLFDPQAIALPADATMLQCGSISLISDPFASRMARLFVSQKGKRVLGLDPNIRPGMVDDEPAYRARLKAMTDVADIIKISRVDLEWLAPDQTPAAWAAERIADGASLIVVTAGSEGATGYGRGFTVVQPVVKVGAVADTVGAGDSFTSGLLASLAKRGLLTVEALAGLDEAAVREALAFAARVAAITVTRAGADPPWAHEM